MYIYLPMKVDFDIKTKVVRWAIGRAGYSLPGFVEKFPKFRKWLEDQTRPTLKQLEDFCQKVHLPFGYLFLQEPPEEELPIPFFRTVSQRKKGINLNVYDTILLIQQRQEWLTEYLSDIKADPLRFVGKFNTKTNFQLIVKNIRAVLNLSEEWASEFSSRENALDHLTHKIEDVGIIVSFNSVVENNNHRPIPVDECRGFVLVNDLAPFMFVNAADAKGAQLFTLIHELAHIWIGESAGFDFKQMLPAQDPTEILCDKVAAEFLVPSNAFLHRWKENSNVATLALHFKVSQIVIARRALDAGKWTREQFFSFYNQYISSDRAKKESQEGGDFYNTQKKRLSLRFTALVNQAVKENKLLYRDAYKITGLKGNTYQQFITKTLH